MPNPTQAVFNPPTSNLDGSPVTPGEIAKYTLQIGLVATPQTFPTTFDDLDVTPAPDGTISVPLASFSPAPAFGSYVGQVIAVTAGGVQSAPSVPASFVLVAPVVTPNPPTALKFV